MGAASGYNSAVPARRRVRAALIAASLTLLACPKPDADGPLSTVTLSVSPTGPASAHAFALRIDRNRGPLDIGTTPAGAAGTFQVLLNGGDNDLAVELVSGAAPAPYRMEVRGGRFLYGEPYVVTGTLDRAGGINFWTLRVPD